MKNTDIGPRTIFIITRCIRQGVSCTDGARSIRPFNVPESVWRSVRVLRNKCEYRQEERVKVTLHTCVAFLRCVPVLLEDLISGLRKKVRVMRKISKSVCVRDRFCRIVAPGLSRASADVDGILGA